jgi:hypothetical protein
MQNVAMPVFRVLTVVALLFAASPVTAETLGTTRVAVIDPTRLWAPGGITKWVKARAALDGEQGSFKVVEAPPGMAPPLVVPDVGLPPKQREALRKKFAELDRESVARQAWQAHVDSVLDPIEKDVMAALERFARAHSIGLVLDRGHLGHDVPVVASGTDITDAFIKHYNAADTKPVKPASRKR